MEDPIIKFKYRMWAKKIGDPKGNLFILTS